MSRKRKLVIIGNGMAGARLAEDVLARGGRDLFDVVMFGDEPYGNYNRILLSGVLGGSHDPKDIFINPLAWYETNGVKLRAGARVTAIDREAKRVIGAGGVVETYDHLVIATGSSPFIPPLEGLYAAGDEAQSAFKQGVFVFRTLDDCEAIMNYAGGGKRATVIGGGLLGLEAARGLLNLGAEVHVVHLAPHLMEVQLDGPAGATLKRSMEAMNVKVHLNKVTAAILGGGHVTGLRFNDGATLDCEMVVISAGIRPNAQLAKDVGLTVERGIVVNDSMACVNDPDVFAVGECAQHNGRVYGLVAPLWEQTAALADRLTGRKPDAAYKGSKVSTKLKVMGIDLTVMGDREARDENDEVVTSPGELRRIADVAEKYNVRMVKITGGQRLDLLGVSKEDLPNVWRDLGMPSGHAYTKAFCTCKTCVGSEFCRFGVGDSVALGIAIEKRYQGIEFPHKVKLATTGCPRNCSEATTKDIGAVAIEGGKWEIYIGGAAGSKVRKGDILVTVETHDGVLLYMGRFMQYYRENAKYLERTYDFAERLGIEKLRAILVDDLEGICARLDAEIKAAADAYVDPWREAVKPVHPSQFVNALPVEEAARALHQIQGRTPAYGD
ncbi:MAG TPA: FAD-dependent oxidoreductase [Blastocatellia bacterium]|nr:FAD-dependent oxidoreductase [Blastocatellia bacterium]